MHASEMLAFDTEDSRNTPRPLEVGQTVSVIGKRVRSILVNAIAHCAGEAVP